MVRFRVTSGSIESHRRRPERSLLSTPRSSKRFMIFERCNSLTLDHLGRVNSSTLTISTLLLLLLLLLSASHSRARRRSPVDRETGARGPFKTKTPHRSPTAVSRWAKRRGEEIKGKVARCVITARLLGSFSTLRSARYTDNEEVALSPSFLRRRHFFDCLFFLFFPPAVSSSSFLSRFRRSTTSPRQPAKRHWEERENKDGRKVPRVVAFSTEEYGGELRDAWGLFEGAGPSNEDGMEGWTGWRERERGEYFVLMSPSYARECRNGAHETHTDLGTNLSRLQGCDSSSTGRDYRYCDTPFARDRK